MSNYINVFKFKKFDKLGLNKKKNLLQINLLPYLFCNNCKKKYSYPKKLSAGMYSFESRRE